MAQKPNKKSKKQNKNISITGYVEKLSDSLQSVKLITDGPQEIPGRNVCLWPIMGTKVLGGKTKLVGRSHTGNNKHSMPVKRIVPDEEKVETKPEDTPFSLYGIPNNIIETKKEYAPYAKRINLDIDWKRQKLFFYTQSNSYKFGTLNSSYGLMGIAISQDGKTLYIRYRSTFHGVCQGIAQLSAWYSYETTTFAVIIPNTVEKVRQSSCYFGPDCSNIP